MYIDGAAKIPSIRCVVFTGGEAFLLGPALNSLVGRATDHGLSARAVTNGYWATTKERAVSRLGSLARSGLKEINFSTGDEHLKFVPLDRIINGVKAAVELGLGVAVMVEVKKNSDFSLEDITCDEEIKALVDSGRVILLPSPWMKFGEGKQYEQNPAYLSMLQKSSYSGCSSILDVITVTPSEDLMACCGLPMEEIEELKLGSLKEKSLHQLVAEGPADFMKIWMNVKGPMHILKFANSVDESIEIPPADAHICAMCKSLYKDPKVKKALGSLPEELVSDVMRNYEFKLIVGAAANAGFNPEKELNATRRISPLKVINFQKLYN